MMYICAMVLGFVIGVIGTYFSLKRTANGTLFINQENNADGEYVFVEFNDDPITFSDEKFITLSVKSISQK